MAMAVNNRNFEESRRRFSFYFSTYRISSNKHRRRLFNFEALIVPRLLEGGASNRKRLISKFDKLLMLISALYNILIPNNNK